MSDDYLEPDDNYFNFSIPDTLDINPYELIDSEQESQDEEEEEEENDEIPDNNNAQPQKKVKFATNAKSEMKKQLYGADVDEIFGSEEMDSELGIGRRKKRKAQRGARNKLPPALSKLMGEANMMYALKEFPQAVEVLRGIIRLAPNVADPYHTMGLIYEEMNDIQKALEFYMIAAHMSPRDDVLWKRLAIMSRDQGKIRQAIYCFTKAIRINSNDVDSIWDRCVLYVEINEIKKAIEGLVLLLKLRPNDVLVAKELARLYHQMGQLDKAVEVVENVLGSQDPNDIEYHLLNILMELYMNIGKFQFAVNLILKLIEERYNTQHNIESTKNIIQFSDEEIPYNKRYDQLMSELPIDIVVNFAICLLHIGHIKEAETHANRLLEQSSVICGDLYYSLAETYFTVNEFQRAITFYAALLSNEEYNKPAIWLRLAKCYKNINNLSSAVSYYNKVIQSVGSSEAVLELSEVYQKQNNTKQALQVLENYAHSISSTGADQSTQVIHNISSIIPHLHWNIDNKVLWQKGLLHYSMGELNQFLEAVTPLVIHAVHMSILAPEISKRKRKLKSKEAQQASVVPIVEDESTLLQFGSKRQKRAPEAQQTPQPDTPVDSSEPAEGPPFDELPPSVVDIVGEEEFFNLIIMISKASAHVGRSLEAAKMLSNVIKHIKFADKTKTDKLHLVTIGLSMKAEEYSDAFEHMRQICIQNPHSVAVWNLFNRIITKAGSFVSHHKFMERLLKKFPESVPLMILVGHHSTMAGSYMLALREYFKAHQAISSDTTVNLCIGTSYLNQVMNRKLPDRNTSILQAFTFFFEYFRLSKENEESCYNMARAFHQLGLLQFAVPLYEKVLSVHPTQQTNLVKEAAHNLCLIYKASGSSDLVHRVMQDFLTQ